MDDKLTFVEMLYAVAGIASIMVIGYIIFEIL